MAGSIALQVQLLNVLAALYRGDQMKERLNSADRVATLVPTSPTPLY